MDEERDSRVDDSMDECLNQRFVKLKIDGLSPD